MMIISSLQGIKADTLTFHRLHRFIRLILVAPLKKSATIQGEKCHYSRRKVPLFNTNYNVNKNFCYYSSAFFEINSYICSQKSARTGFTVLAAVKLRIYGKIASDIRQTVAESISDVCTHRAATRHNTKPWPRIPD